MTRWLHKLVSVFRHRRLDSELDEEIRGHLEMATEENVLSGMSPREAQLAARRSFGGIDQVKEQYRDVRGFRWLYDLGQDVRLAFRTLRKDRAFAAVTVLTLTVGIGANTAIFSVVEGVLLRPLPYPDADRIVRVAAQALPQAEVPEVDFSDGGYWHFVNNNRSFEAFGGYSAMTQRFPLVHDGPPQEVDVGFVTAAAFEVLGMQPQVGRLPTLEEGLRLPVFLALISHGLWVNRYGSDPSIIGRTVQLENATFEVIGVMPEGFDFPTPQIDVWTLRGLNPESENVRQHRLLAIARLAPSVTIDAAVDDAEALIAGFDEVGYDPERLSNLFSGRAIVRPLKDEVVGDARAPLLILLGTAVCVLLIACSNVANLLLARAESRTRERAVRIALGSGRGRLIQYIMMESALLALAGGVCGIGLAYVGTQTLVSAGPASIPRLDEIGINGTALLFTTVVSVAAALLFGLLPAARAGSGRALTALRDGGMGSTIGRGRNRARGGLVVAQMALALVLLVGSGLMVRSFQQLRSVAPGFDAEGVITFGLAPLGGKYRDPDLLDGRGAREMALFYDPLLERLADVPGVTSVGAVSGLPLTGSTDMIGFQIDEFPTPEGEPRPNFLFKYTTAGYFETMGIPIHEGREFIRDEHRETAFIISESVKRRYWPNESALGKQITFVGTGRVVGVAGDVHDTGLETPAEPTIYVSWIRQQRQMMIAVRTAGDPNLFVPAIRVAVAEVDPDVPIARLQSMDDILGDSLNRTSFTMWLLLLAAGIALFLGTVGIYSVISYIVSQRTSEIGVRMALGAASERVGGMILMQGMRLAGAGVVIGLLAAAAMGVVFSPRCSMASVPPIL